MLKDEAQKSNKFLLQRGSHVVHIAREKLEKISCVYCFLVVFGSLSGIFLVVLFWFFVFKKMLLKRQLASLTGKKLAQV